MLGGGAHILVFILLTLAAALQDATEAQPNQVTMSELGTQLRTSNTPRGVFIDGSEDPVPQNIEP